MRKIFYFFLFTFLSNDLLASPFAKFKTGYDKLKGKYDDTKSKIDEAKGKVDEVKGKIDEVKGDIKKVTKDIGAKYSENKNDANNIKGGGRNDSYPATEQQNGVEISKEEYIKWAQYLQNLSPAGLRKLVYEMNFFKDKTRQLEESIKASRNIKKFVLITDVSIENE